MRIFRIFLLSFVLFIFCVPGNVFAESYKVTPRIIDRDVEKREIFTEILKVTNNANHVIEVYPSVNQVAVDEGGDITEFLSPSMTDKTVTITSWLSIRRAAHSIKPGETVEIPLEVKIHPEAEAGVYHAVIGFGTGRNREEALQKVQSGSAPSVFLTLRIDQEQTELLKLGNFFIDRFVTKGDNKAIHYALSNPGEAEVVPKGEIIFYNTRGEEVASIPVNPDKETIVPGQKSEYEVAAPIEHMLGKYKAFLTIDYGTEQVASVYDTVYFYVLPWQKLLIIFGIVLVFAIILTIILHRRMAGPEVSDGSEDIAFFVREDRSEEKEHDINLKKKE